MNYKLTTPVLFLVFNRPTASQAVFDAIRKARPSVLYIAADGPRKDQAGEVERCQEVRDIVSNVDWDCEVKTLFRDENLGLGKAIAGGISWFFEHEEEGIILEDDTMPSLSFFRFCSEMLEYYRDDTRIMAICGSTLPNTLMENPEYSYFFSNWDHPWGWATWRRAWKHFDYTMPHYPEAVAQGYLKDTYTSIHERFYLERMLDRSYHQNDEVTWWSVQWGFARKMNSGLVVVPLKNMIINLGLGEDATNTVNASQWSFMEFEDMKFPIKHPEFVMHDRITDKEIFLRFYTRPFTRFKRIVKYVTPEWIYGFFKTLAHRLFSSMVICNYVAVDIPWG
jgi:hypothetical protein